MPSIGSPSESPSIYTWTTRAGTAQRRQSRHTLTACKEKYNVIVVFQPPRSPESNACDLGFWRSLQSHVEKLHYRRRSENDALARTVMDAWAEYPAEKLTRIFDRLPKVMQLIIDDDGGNEQVEVRRGKLTGDPVVADDAAPIVPNAQ